MAVLEDLGIIIAGQAGQGIQVVSRTLCRLLVRSGYFAFSSQDVMSRIRGGHNFARVRVSSRPVQADADGPGILLAMDPALVGFHAAAMPAGALVLVDGDADAGRTDLRMVKLPMQDLARQHGKDPVMANSVCLGALAALLGLDFEPLGGLLGREFERKGADVAGRNVAAGRAGYGFVSAELRKECPCCLGPATPVPGRLVLTGTEAMALGAIAAGVRVVTGYPMSPATPILEYCMKNAEAAGLAVEQTEDEVSAINLALGASFAGCRAMTCTAGGGFALMNEGLSLAGMTETPLVVCLGMRPGPATGLATRTAQADLLFAIHAGHGEFPRAVLTPADAKGAFRAVGDALYLAEKHQTPVIVLFDQYLGDALWTVDAADLKPGLPEASDTGPALPHAEPYSYRRYAPAAGGASPRLRPGTAGQLVYADSDEHTEEGHITESAEMRVRMVDKRNAKLAGIAAELPEPAAEPGPDAETVVFSFGSSRGVVAEAVARLRQRHAGLATVSLEYAWPFPAEAVRRLTARARRVITVEANYTGQLAQLLAQECGLRVMGTVRRFDGRPFAVAEVEQGIGQYLE